MAEKLCCGHPPPDGAVPAREDKPAGGGGASAARALAAGKSRVEAPQDSEFSPPVRPPTQTKLEPVGVAEHASGPCSQGSVEPDVRAHPTDKIDVASGSTAPSQTLGSLGSEKFSVSGNSWFSCPQHQETLRPAQVAEEHGVDVFSAKSVAAKSLIKSLGSGELHGLLPEIMQSDTGTGTLHRNLSGFNKMRSSLMEDSLNPL